MTSAWNCSEAPGSPRLTIAGTFVAILRVLVRSF